MGIVRVHLLWKRLFRSENVQCSEEIGMFTVFDHYTLFTCIEIYNPALWSMLVILSRRRLRQEDYQEFEACLGYIVSSRSQSKTLT